MTTLRDILHIPGPKGVDIDDTAIVLKDIIVPYVNKTFGGSGGKLIGQFTENDYVWLGLENIKIISNSGITREDVSDMLKKIESKRVIENIPLRVYCMASMRTLSESDPIYFLTSRGNGFYNDAKGMTDRWLVKIKADHNFSPVDVIYDHNKEKAMRKYHLELLFDDNPTFALEVMKKGKPVVLFDAPWNYVKNHDKTALSKEMYDKKKLLIDEVDSYEHKLLFRVKDWYTVFKNLV